MSVSLNIHQVTSITARLKQYAADDCPAFDAITLELTHKVGINSSITLMSEPGALLKDCKFILEAACES